MNLGTATRSVVGPALAAAVFLVTTVGGDAAAQTPEPTVTAHGLDGSIVVHTDCRGSVSRRPNQAMFAIRRTGDTSGPLTVHVSYDGTLSPGEHYDPLPDPVVIAAGSDSRLLPTESTHSGSITVAIRPGSGYAPADPSTATVEIEEIPFAADCAPEESQNVRIGGTPTPIDVYDRFGGALADTYFTIDGELPPGLTFMADGSWTGAASTHGTFRFTAKYCLGDTCALELPITIVVSDLDEPARAAAPAVEAEVRFTG